MSAKNRIERVRTLFYLFIYFFYFCPSFFFYWACFVLFVCLLVLARAFEGEEKRDTGQRRGKNHWFCACIFLSVSRLLYASWWSIDPPSRASIETRHAPLNALVQSTVCTSNNSVADPIFVISFLFFFISFFFCSTDVLSLGSCMNEWECIVHVEKERVERAKNNFWMPIGHFSPKLHRRAALQESPDVTKRLLIIYKCIDVDRWHCPFHESVFSDRRNLVCRQTTW